MPPKRSIVHQFFHHYSDDKVICTLCPSFKPLSVLGGNSNLKRHLETNHPEEWQTAQDDPAPEVLLERTNNRRTIVSRFFEETGEENKLRCTLCVEKDNFLSKSGGFANFIRHLQTHHPLAMVRGNYNPPVKKQKLERISSSSPLDVIEEQLAYSPKNDLITQDQLEHISLVEGEETVCDLLHEEAEVFELEAPQNVEENELKRLQVQKIRLEVYKLKLEVLKLERDLQLPRSSFTEEF